MVFRKTGAGDGHIIDVQPTLAKLGSKIECGTCGKKFAVNSPQDFEDCECPSCKEASREAAGDR